MQACRTRDAGLHADCALLAMPAQPAAFVSPELTMSWYWCSVMPSFATSASPTSFFRIVDLHASTQHGFK
jgi:hypothetical protein